MAVDKLVDSAQLDASMSYEAGRIRAKLGSSAQLYYDPANGKGFGDYIDAIPTGITPTGTKQISINSNGTTTEDVTNYASAQITVAVPAEEYYRVPSTGCIYPKVLDITLEGYSANNYGGRRWGYCSEMTEATIRGMTVLNNMISPVFQSCKKLKKVKIPDASGSNNSFIVISSTAVEEIQIGSIGHAMTAIYGNAFSGCTQSGLTITIYVNASSLADVPSNVKDRSPFGATNAEIVYRSSTTGEVLT